MTTLVKTKPMYILSDSKRLSHFSNIISLPTPNGNKIIPASSNKMLLSYIKETTRHPYYVVDIELEDLKKLKSGNEDIMVIDNMYCCIETKKHFMESYSQ